jgi:hypothetical protein
MTADDDRATILRCQELIDRRWRDEMSETDVLSALRSAISVPDAAALKAEARREAIEASKAESSAWLIEWRKPGHQPVWWSGPGRHGLWSTPEFAVRFSRQEDALTTVRYMGLQDCIATEHLWFAAEPPARGEKEQEQGQRKLASVGPASDCLGTTRAGPASSSQDSQSAARRCEWRECASGDQCVREEAHAGGHAFDVSAARPPAPLWPAPASPYPCYPSAAPPAPLDDAAVLERAAEILDRRPPTDAKRAAAENLRQWAHRERVSGEPPAPAPEPDVFEAFARDVLCDEFGDALTSQVGPMADRAREWFGPLVEALKKDARLCDCDGWPARDGATHRETRRGQRARVALAQLRARAKAVRP